MREANHVQRRIKMPMPPEAAMPVGLNMEGHVTVRDSEAQLNLAAIRARHQSALCCPCCGPEHATRLLHVRLPRPFASMQARADLDAVQHMRPKHAR